MENPPAPPSNKPMIDNAQVVARAREMMERTRLVRERAAAACARARDVIARSRSARATAGLEQDG